MKTIICLLTGIFLSADALAAPKAKMTVTVINAETKAPMTNAVVRTRFLVQSHWNEADEYVEQKCIPNADGFCVLSNADDSFGHGGGITANNYYKSSFDVPYTGINRVLNRWEPWNPTIEVEMRKIKNPIPMVYKRQKWTVVPEFGTQIGYDLEAGDWVAPHGKGKTEDFLFLMNLDRKSMADAEASYTLSFSNPLDGIQEYLPSEDLRSSFIFPYVAPANGYKKSLYQHDITTPYGPSKTTEKENINYIFRVRTKTDKDENIVSSCYGRIRGELKISRKGQVEFAYWFNPEPNNRSLESLEKPY